MASHDAVCVLCTVARIHALFVAASQNLRAVVIDNALWPAAGPVGVAQVAGRTDAAGLVVARFAQCVYATFFIIARVLAFALYACLRKGALKVTVASRFYACSIWIAFKAGRTSTDRPVVVDPAYGGGRALLGDARIPAFLPNACKGQGTFRVGCAFRFGWLSNRLANLICVSFIARRTNAVSSVVPSLTDSINAALVVVNTRVLALLGDTGQNTGAVAVHRTLGLALRIGVSLKSRRTGAATVVSVAPSNSVNSTRVGIAGIADVWLNGRWTPALHQGVADVAGQTGADRRVSSDFTSGVSSTDPRAGVVAVQVLAGHVGWTVWVNDTLWFALGVWVALVVGRTGAFAVVSNLARNGAGPAGVGITRIRYLWLRFEAAADEGVADVIRNTCTDRGVVDDAAVRVVPAHPGAGVNTLSP